MNRLFFRFFVLVMLAITVATLLVHFAITHWFGDPLDDIARRQASAEIFLLEQYVDKAPGDEWLARLNKVREVSQVQLELVPLPAALAKLKPRWRDALVQGELVLDPANKAFLRRVDLKGERYVGSADDVIYAHNLPIDVRLAIEMEALRYVIVALVVLVPIALWSRAHWRGLQALSAVADRFGAGDLAARASFPRSASIFPLSERINHMAGRIQTLVSNQDHLLHSVSHELRTPIARLEFALALLRDKMDDPSLATRLDAMQADLAELNGLVSELLGMARLGQEHTLALAPVDLPALFDACTAALTHPVDLQLGELPPSWTGEQRLLARALGNVLCNADKYAQSCIILQASASAGHLQIAIEDDGPGIPDAEREAIFEPFYRLDRSRDRGTGGFGLGLAIARKAIHLHRGSIRAETGSLGGARFVITLPLLDAGVA